jgi:predicted nucleotidyltransferase
MDKQQKIGLGIAQIIGDKRDQILKTAARYGATNVRVFGSVARGEARPDSDVDLLVRFKPDYKLRDHLGLTVALKDVLGRPVDIAIEANLRAEIRPAILEDALML